jgi:hypothetical protein
MSTPAACYENIIGLSRTECPCVEERPEGANVTESGIFLDELPGLNLQKLNATQSCGSGGLWDKLEKARENAIEETVSELMSCIAANTDAARGIGSAQIGEDKRATGSAHKLNHAYHGMTVQTAKVIGGSFYVDAIGTAFKPQDGLPETITVNVYQRIEASEDPIATYVLPIAGNKVVWTDIAPLALSMDAMGTDNPRFFFLFEPWTGAKAMNSLVNCDCGGFAPYWDLASPQYDSRQQKAGKLWADWAMAGGTFGGDLERRDEWTVENPTSGLLLRVRFECDERSTFCTGQPNYTTDNVQKVIAHTVRYRAGYNLLTDLLHSVDINRYTMTAGEAIEALRAEYLKAFEDRAKWVCEQLSDRNNVNRYGDCRKCKDVHGMRRGLIRN